MKRISALIVLLMAVSMHVWAAVTVTVNGSNHTIPQTGEKGWGTNVTAWIQAISSNTLQPSGGTFTLTADANFGASYGLVSSYFKSRSSNISTAGILRLANTDTIGFRNAANGGNLLLGVDSSDRLTFNSNLVSTATTGSFQDSTFELYDNSDNTKKIAFQASGITTATTRTITMPDANVDLTDVSSATSSNTNSTIVKRDGSGNFSAGTVTASLTGNVTGNASTATALAADPSDCGADTYATTIAASGNLTCATVTNAGLAGSIDDSKLNQITTAGKVANTATTATSANTVSAIVARDGSGNFSAGTISAALNGNATTSTSLAANPADCSANNYATTIAANGDLTCSQVSLTAGVSGVLPIANGGSNKALTLAAGGVIYSDADSFEVTAAGTSNQYLKSNGSSAPTWATFTQPTVQTFTSGSGTYTTPAGVKSIEVIMVGSGGSGTGSGTASSSSNGVAGENTTFGSSLLTANGGGAVNWSASSGGTGGGFTVSAPAIDIGSAYGDSGDGSQFQAAASFAFSGGQGGSTCFGGGGKGGHAAAGGNAQTNSGAGGAGGGTDGINEYSGPGGGGGGCVRALITAPDATYAYSVGAAKTGGSAGTSGYAGGNSAAGKIIVIEYYQ